MNSLNRYMVPLVVLIAFVMGGAVVTSVRQVQATPEAAPQVIDLSMAFAASGVFHLVIYYPDKQRIYYWSKETKSGAPTCHSMRINSPGQPPTANEACD